MFKKSYQDRGSAGFKGGKKFGHKGSWNKKSDDFGFGGGEREMHHATCNECGNDCQVPFRPNGRKPVFCNNCFVRDEDNGGRFERPSYGEKRPYVSTPRFAPKTDNGAIERQLKEINGKLDQILSALQQE